MLELHGKGDVKKLRFLWELKNIFQIYSLHKQGFFCFRIVSKGRIFQNIFLDNANSNGSRRALVACDNSTLKIRKICFSSNNEAVSVSKNYSPICEFQKTLWLDNLLPSVPVWESALKKRRNERDNLVWKNAYLLYRLFHCRRPQGSPCCCLSTIILLTIKTIILSF